ncbi:alpha-L-rhamnosidase-related protein [Streptantibioticus silvisoli]|uniref:Alpha-L-rhamnosidase C-terminal domain-containing protein n=1 Tax=Streptantibioticus silvisoli TaxID=2705255 RepID=A0ABT6VZ96_9ACTN|nr:alpha-L-rhamnosidase C-terminal domain-containing protein [Streptantibioticus silvisoli]MDI5963809.1 alpha-L-rhamnosidase C-terminal domain-containing protein [Streptantibioticus silvisoli]
MPPEDELRRRTFIRTSLAAAAVAGTGFAAAGGAAPAASAAGRPTAGPAPAPSGPWDAFNLSPASRTVRPVAVRTSTGSVRRGRAPRGGGVGTVRLSGTGASVTLDFGQEVGGFVTLAFGAGTGADQVVALTYAELSTYISTTASDASNGGTNDEPAVRYAATPGGTVDTRTDVPLAGADPVASANPASQLRGGFRYLTVVNDTSGTVELTGVTLAVGFAPNAADLRAYPNYFHCDDDLLNRIWYAGAYTVQTNIIAVGQGRTWGPPAVGWDNSAPVGEAGTTVLVDGAKRDRTVWPGDLGISVLTDYVSLGDLLTVRNSLQTLYNHQDPATGALPYAGPAVDFVGNSDTYHLWTLIGTAAYLQFSGDTDWMRGIYPQYRKAVTYITGKIAADGLLDVTASADWARTDADGKNIEANAIMYRALRTAGAPARAAGDSASADAWAALAATLKSAIADGGYWDEAAGLYRDKPTGDGAALYPQDGNALAVWFGLADDADRARTVSASLAKRWTAVGALTPEKGDGSVHPFPGGMEVHAHFTAGREATALDLIRREWGYMLNAPQGTASTFWEGYRSDGTSDYSGSYMSASHGWSTGPTSALTFHVLGIAPAADGGPGCTVAPHPGGLRSAQGRLTTPSGPVDVSWQAGPGGRFDLRFSAPAAVVGQVEVPVPDGAGHTVLFDGVPVWDGAGRSHGARRAGDRVRFDVRSGGAHTVSVRTR